MSATDDLLTFQTALLLELLRESDATTVRLLRLYKTVYDRLSRDWLALLEEIEAERTSHPESPTAALDLLVFRSERIHQLRLQTAAQIAVFAREAARLVKADQQMAVDVGRIHAGRVLTQAAQTARIDVSFATLPKRALEQLVGRFSNGEPLKALFDQIGVDAARKAEETLFTSVATGEHPTTAARKMRVQLGIPLTRSLSIARTEMLTAYRSANLKTFAENADVVQGWRWNAHLDGRTCSACIGLHGTVWPLSVSFFPGHVRCRCSPSPVLVDARTLGLPASRIPKSQTGPEWFDQQSAETQRRILGPRKYDLFRAGKLDIEDTVYEDVSEQWGSSYREGSIAYALAVHDHAKPWQVYE